MNGTRKCLVDDCAREYFGRGYCNTHYYRLRRNGTLDLKSKDEISRRRLELTTVCEIDQCARVAHRRCDGKRVCQMHAKRFTRHGDFQTVKRKWGAPNPEKVACAVEGCEGLEDGNAGYCKLHDTRQRRHGNPLAVTPHIERAFPRGEDHPHWSEDASYRTVHQRIRAARGSASQYGCIECPQPAAQWAYQHASLDERHELIDGNMTPYGMDVFDYAPMCVKCHKTFDMKRIMNEKEKKEGVHS